MIKKIATLIIPIFIIFSLYSCIENKKTPASLEKVIESHNKSPTTNIKNYQKITSPLYIKVNSEGVWFASEGDLGLVRIVNNDNQLLNKKGNLGILTTIDGNWMHSNSAFFDTEIDFEIKEEKSGKIIITSNPGEGDGNEAGTVYTIEIPVIF